MRVSSPPVGTFSAASDVTAEPNPKASLKQQRAKLAP
jgi:hypothetical protein